MDFAWVILAAALVLLMQVGFMLLEAGMVRSKNAINVAQKNLLDFAFSVVAFAGVGFMVAFGASQNWFFGYEPGFLMLSGLDSWGLAFFVFQVMFCGTAATIVSGAVAERMRLPAYVLCSVFISGLVYPVYVHWAWGTALMENPGAFLAHMGFVDFAGSTVVHGTGAWVALAACIVIGPRLGRFDANGKPVRFHGHSPVLATTGAFLLFVGWIGFNGGSTLQASSDIAHIIANTVLAAATGGVAGYFVGWYREKLLLPEKAFSGMLGGLVAVTAGCAVLDSTGAMIIGLLGGVAALYGIALLENRFRIDDAVGAVGVHGIAGIVGTLGLALLAPTENLAMPRLNQLAVQSLGSALNFVWSFSLGLAFFHVLRKFVALRVDASGEDVGLNESEHGTRLGIGHVEDAVGQLVSGKADLSLRLPVAHGDDSERMTVLFNALMDSIENEEIQRGIAKEIQRDDEEAERLKALANATFEAIVISVDGVIIDGNKAAEELYGFPLSELKGTPISLYTPEEDWNRLQEELKHSESGPYELRAIRSDGELIPIEVRAREIMYRGRQTRVSAVVDLRERKAAEERIRHLAQHDPLTDLPNRALFGHKLESALSSLENSGNGAAVIVLDLDRFKDINDLHGHLVGDKVIQATAERLLGSTRRTDTVARMGGDEFAIIQRDVQFSNQVADMAHRLVDILAQPINCGDGLILRTGASVGIALCPAHGNDIETIMSRADTALYKAKSLGRNTFCVFEEGMDEIVRKRQRLEVDLSAALEEEQFELYLQPRLDVATQEIKSYEALIRWNHPDKGLIPPSDFIPVAEQSNRIVAIGEWVLRRACEIAAKELGTKRVSVNVSPLQFREKDFVATVRSTLEAAAFDPARLEIEITENVLIDDDKHALRILKELKALGVRVALDDFGTGYSSLGYLSRFPFDVIKIDRSFVQGIQQTENALAIVETIVRLGRALGMTIVAEGVETVEELQLLAGEGCTEIQGYLVGRPEPVERLCKVPPAEVIEALDAGSSDLIAQLKSIAADMRKSEAREAKEVEAMRHRKKNAGSA
ncbi:MAG: ammonium transporter [Rhodobiaceae bacterium]|nr:ammonium transporter [Rhodobiaceae bacterium]